MSNSGSLFTRSPSASLFPQAYRSNYFGEILFDPSYALAQDPDLYRKILRDPVVKQAVDHRARAVAQKTWQLKPASEDSMDVELARVLEFLVRKCQRLNRSLRHLAGAFFFGSAYAHIQGQVESVRLPWDGTSWRLWSLKRLKPVDRRMFRQRNAKSKDGTISVFWEMARTSLNHGIAGRSKSDVGDWVRGDGMDGRWDASDFVKHKYEDPQWALDYGEGLIEACYWYYFAKQIAFREGLQGLERWAQGILVFKGSADKSAEPDNPNTTWLTNAITKIKTNQGRDILGIDKDDTLEVHDGPSTGWEQTKWWNEHLDDGITRLITGALRPLGGGGGQGDGLGGGGKARVEERTQDMVAQGDQEELGDTLGEDVIRTVYEVNLPALEAMGLAEGNLPTWEFTQDVVEDPTVNAGVIQIASSMGLALDEDDVYDKMGLKKPTPGHELKLTPPAPANPFGGFGGEGGGKPGDDGKGKDGKGAKVPAGGKADDDADDDGPPFG